MTSVIGREMRQTVAHSTARACCCPLWPRPPSLHPPRARPPCSLSPPSPRPPPPRPLSLSASAGNSRMGPPKRNTHAWCTRASAAHLDSQTTALLWAYASPTSSSYFRSSKTSVFGSPYFLRQHRRLCHVCLGAGAGPSHLDVFGPPSPALRPIPIVTIAPSSSFPRTATAEERQVNTNFS